jgi:uncharacterized protein (DUF779 family)
MMFKKTLGALIGAALLIPVLAQAAPPAGTIFSPYKGVLCDRQSGFCADEQGISMGLTKEYLGEPAQRKLMEVMGSDSDLSEFTMADGTRCMAKQRICTTSKYSDTLSNRATVALFGSLPAAAKPHPSISFPEAGVICDKSSGMCVDQQGISVAMTKMYLGNAAESKLMKLLRENPDMDTKNYVLINGVDCRSDQRVCMATRGGTSVERRYTKQLFGG